jgi:hypothetical protein
MSGVQRSSYLEIKIAVWFASDCQSGPIRGRKDARVAQLVEQRTENPRVGGSNPPPGTTFLKKINSLRQSSPQCDFCRFY